MKTIMSSFLLVVSALTHQAHVYAQSLDILNRYGNSDLYYSDGFEERAASVAELVENAIVFHSTALNFKPDITILVLAEDDWHSYTLMPVYGMPHYTDDKTLIVAASDNLMWRSFIPDLSQLPAPLAKEVMETYGAANGTLTMQGFFDLLVLHELGHAFHLQGGLNVQRKWMGELFCNLFLHTYVAERAPDLLKSLTVFPEMVVSKGAESFLYRTLPEFEENYVVLGEEHPVNYGWYQSRLHVAARKIYEASGREALLRLWKTLQSSDSIADDRQFANLLKEKVGTSVSDVFFKW